MWLVEKNFKVKIGGNTYINVGTLITYKGKSLFTVKRHDDNGYLGIYFDIYNQNKEHVASIKRNEILEFENSIKFTPCKNKNSA